MHAILITKDDDYRGDVDPNLLEQATVEVLRACAFAAETVLIPASMHLLPYAAVIAHDIRQIAPGPEATLRFPIARFVPIAREPTGLIETVRPFLRADLGAPICDGDKGQGVLSFETALADHPPEVVVALTTDEFALKLLSSLQRKPRVLYFESLLRGRLDDLKKQLGPVASDLINLEQGLAKVDDRDKESGRSDDEGLEPFVPFGVLLQEALWPEQEASSR
jgi:hypothetical protein